MNNSKVILFTHIQKTAGTTLGRLLKAKYGFWPLGNFRNLNLALGLHNYHVEGDFPEKRVLALQQLSDAEKRKVRLVQGHMGFGIHRYFSQPYQYITVVRDPVHRVLSHYNQLQQQDWFTYKNQIRSMSLERFIESYPVDALRNLQVKMLAGIFNSKPGDMTPYQYTESDSDLLETAKKNLDDYYLVVFTERFDESVLLMKRKLGWRNSYYVRSNVTRVRKRKKDLDRATVELLRQHNSLDIQLYEYALKKFGEEVEDLDEPFQKEVEAFRKTNGRLNQLFYRPVDQIFSFGRAMNANRNRAGN